MYGLLCCGPNVERNVVYSSDDDSGSEGDDTQLDVIRWPGTASSTSRGQNTLLAADEAPTLLPSRAKKPSELQKVGRSGPVMEDARFVDRVAGSWKGMQMSLRSMFSPRPSRKRPSTAGTGTRVREFRRHDRNRGADDGLDISDSEESRTELNLAYRETRRLPDVAGEERVAWAAGVLRIDLTETGIRTLRGLDAFPNVQTLVLDSNGLLSLPMDCPWVPSLETLWLCNNEIENLDGLLCQVNDAFPRLTTLALMGNPVWPAAKSRARAAGAAAAQSKRASARQYASAGSATAGMGAGSHLSEGRDGANRGSIPGLEGQEERAYRLHVVRRLPGLLTLDCADVTEEERIRAKQENSEERLMDVTKLLLEPEAMTDREESLPRDSPPTSTKASLGLGYSNAKMLEDERKRRMHLPDRSSLPSTWYKEPVVMDVGSGWTRMGLAGEDRPSCVFPSIVGRVDLRSYDRVLGHDERVFAGHGAVAEANKRAYERDLPGRDGPMASPIMLDRPMSEGVVNDWDAMEVLWRHGIEEEMGLDAMEHPVLMADSTRTTPAEREKATEVLFETMSTPAVHMALQPVLALYACGPSSGLVVDIGESGTQVAPIFDGFVLEKGVRQLNLGGRDITRQLSALVNAKVCLAGADELELDDPCDVLKLEALKSKVCFVSENVDADNAKMELSISKPYTLPDGTKITLGRERYRASEILFDPRQALRNEESLQNTILDSILACERKTWAVLAQTVILTGGTTELAGLNRRLQRELTKTSRASGIRLKFTVMVPEDDHNNTVWIGGSMLASTGALDGLWFTRAEYEEYGADPIHAKFAA